jgi:hypothetical protein
MQRIKADPDNDGSPYDIAHAWLARNLPDLVTQARPQPV